MDSVKTLNKYELRMVKSVLTSQNILEYLKFGPKTQDELVEALDIHRTTIYDPHLKSLMKKGLVEYEDKKGAVGRPKRYFKLTHEVLMEDD